MQHANRYKPLPKDRWAFVEHVDNSIMTLLMQNGKDGLEILYNDEWIKVPFRKNTFVANLGNILEHITSGVMKGKYLSSLSHG